MAGSRNAGRRGVSASAQANQDTGLSSVNYSAFTASTLPAGLAIQFTTGAFATGLSISVNASAQMTEPNSITTNGTYFSGYAFNERMKNQPYSVGVGNALRANSDRGIGAGMCNDDGSAAVFFIMCGNTTACRIYTWAGGVLTQQVSTASIFSTSNTDVLWLDPAVGTDGLYTYTVRKNSTPTACTWKDSAAVIGVPGRHPMAAFRHTYSSGQNVSPGVKSLAAALV